MMLRTVLVLMSFLACARAEESKPNILFLFADDMSWKTVRSLGSEDIDTPNLDRLAARGTTFTHAYNSGGWHGAICVASRTMLMTGRQLWRARDAEPRLNQDYVAKGRMWPQQIAARGYRTCFAGKWHVQADHKKVFGEIGHFRAGGMPKDGKNAYFRPVEGQPDPWSASDPAEGGYWAGGKHWSAVMADDFSTFLGGKDERPWFMYLAFNAPHDPRQSPQEYLDRYPLSRVQVPANFLPLYPHRAAMGAAKGLRDENLAPFPRTPFAVKTHRREYYAAVTYLDTQIGRILDELAASGAAANTYIFFTADHGLSCGEHGLLGKQNLYDASVRVPFIVAGPGVPSGLKVEAPVYLQDAMPTVLKLAGAEVADDVDFRDLRPHWEGKGKPREAVTGAYRDLQRMIECDGKKLILYPAVKVARVFDLAADPDEKTDLAGTPGGDALAAELFEELLEIQQETGDPLDLRSVFASLLSSPAGEKSR
ncbi:sulfatase-like hydrolase/transferase [Luteolibacter marinus]|uniref:sulfatase-like hydrolase/transferase n=1 Tax=Luteolibacter marinus TaxID=2776705 RepID=UPI001D009218|nr:sulfatase-like hydrolase/transferase [Luteolibacter marinus]